MALGKVVEIGTIPIDHYDRTRSRAYVFYTSVNDELVNEWLAQTVSTSQYRRAISAFIENTKAAMLLCSGFSPQDRPI